MKISILVMNNRYVVKFEKDGLEQSYKIRPDLHIDSVHDIKLLFGKDKIEKVREVFTTMKQIKLSLIIPKDESDHLEEII